MTEKLSNISDAFASRVGAGHNCCVGHKSTRVRAREAPQMKTPCKPKAQAREIPRERVESSERLRKRMARVQKTWSLPARPG